MPEYLGPIEIPEYAASGTFPVQFAFGSVEVREPPVATHQFGTADTTIEQRFYLGPGQRVFRLTLPGLSLTERNSLTQFFVDRLGSLTPFTLNYVDHDGSANSATVRFAEPVLTLEQAQVLTWAGQIDLVAMPASPPSYTSASVVTRLPGVTLTPRLLEQAQEIIPLVKIGSNVYVSDRKVTVDATLYQPRILDWDGIQQSIDDPTDQVTLSLGNADRVWKLLLDQVDLRSAPVTFSLFHVGTLIKLDLWAGEVAEFGGESKTVFSLRCWDRIADQRIAYPVDTISRQYPGMAVPDQPVNVGGKKGISPITATSVTNDTAYGRALKDVFVNNATQPLPVDCDLIAGRDESEFYAALGIVGRGPISGFYSGIDFPHALDGQPHHGPGALGLRRAYGGTPATGDPTAVDDSPDDGSISFALDEVGQPLPNNPCDGVAFIQIRRVDEKGIQPIQVDQETMKAYLTGGLGCWTWTAPGTRVWTPACVNPAWVVVNVYLRALGLGTASYTAQEAVFDATAAITAATFYATVVNKIIGAGTEPQFEVNGLILAERRPLRDWMREILGACLGYYTFRYGKLVLGVRYNSSAAEAFTAGNVILGSIETQVHDSQFNSLTVAFPDPEYGYQQNTINLQDATDIAARGQRDGQRNLICAASKSQAARLTTTIFREEMGGITTAEKRAARRLQFSTTVLALNVEPGMVCSLTHEDAPGGAMEFRVRGWTLNRDYSITIDGTATTDSMYDLTIGDKPTDVSPDVLPQRPAYSLLPGDVQAIGGVDFEATLTEDGVSEIIAIRYNPPAVMGAFWGVVPVVEITAASGNYFPQGNWKYNGDPDAIDEDRYGTGTIVIPSPGGARETWRVYLLSRSAVLTKTLDPLNSPQVDIEVGRFTGYSSNVPAWNPIQTQANASDAMFPSEWNFELFQKYTPMADGSSAAIAQISGRLPVTKFRDVAAPDADIAASSTGGSLPGGTTFYVYFCGAAAPVSGLTTFTPLSRLLTVTTPVGTSTCKITLSNMTWPDDEDLNQAVFFAHSQKHLICAQQIESLPLTTVDIPGPFTRSTLGLPGAWSFVNIKAKRLIHGGVLGAEISDVGSSTITSTNCIDAADTDDWTGRVLCLIGRQNAIAPWAAFNITDFDYDTGVFTLDRNPTGIAEIGDAFVVCTLGNDNSATPTVITDTGLSNALNTDVDGDPSPHSGLNVDVEIGRILRVIKGKSRGQWANIIDNDATTLTLDRPVVCDATSIWIVEVPVWDSLNPASAVGNADPYMSTDLSLNVLNYVRQSLLVAGYVVDINGQETPEEFACLRMSYVWGNPGGAFNSRTFCFGLGATPQTVETDDQTNPVTAESDGVFFEWSFTADVAPTGQSAKVRIYNVTTSAIVVDATLPAGDVLASGTTFTNATVSKGDMLIGTAIQVGSATAGKGFSVTVRYR